MVSGCHTCRTPCCNPRHHPCDNPSIAASGPDEFARAAQGQVQDLAKSAFIADSKGATIPSNAGILASFNISISALIPVFTLISTVELFKQFIKTYKPSAKVLKQNKVQAGQACTSTKSQKRFLKAKVPNVYYGRLHIDCFHFC